MSYSTSPSTYHLHRIPQAIASPLHMRLTLLEHPLNGIESATRIVQALDDLHYRLESLLLAQLTEIGFEEGGLHRPVGLQHFELRRGGAQTGG